jgi:KDO2-lipid IV(A) lauroyltransferase
VSRSHAPSRSRRFTHRLEYLTFRLAGPLLGACPRALRGVFAWGVALLWYYLIPIRRRLVLDNLRVAFPERDAAWRGRIARRCLVHFMRMMIFEALDLMRPGSRDARDLVAAVEGEEHARAVGLGERGSLVVSAHFGNWEVCISHFAQERGVRVAAVAKPMHNALVEAAVDRGRRAAGWETISTRPNPIPLILRALRDGKAVALLADQDARRDGIFVPFFGRLASTPAGPAVLAVRLKVPLLPVLCRRGEDGLYRVRFYPPLHADPAAPREVEVERLTRAHAAILEEAVREHPEQYFWFHNRWRTRPQPGAHKPPCAPSSERRAAAPSVPSEP